MPWGSLGTDAAPQGFAIGSYVLTNHPSRTVATASIPIGRSNQSRIPLHAGPRDLPFLRSHSKQIAHTFTPDSVNVQQFPHTIRRHEAHGPAASFRQNAHIGGASSPTVCRVPVTFVHHNSCLRYSTIPNTWLAETATRTDTFIPSCCTCMDSNQEARNADGIGKESTSLSRSVPN